MLARFFVLLMMVGSLVAAANAETLKQRLGAPMFSSSDPAAPYITCGDLNAPPTPASWQDSDR